MERKNSVFGNLSLFVGAANLLACFFLFRVGETAQGFLLLWIPLIAVVSGVIGLFHGGTQRVNAIFGTLAGLIPIGFLLLVYAAFSGGNFNFMFK